MDSDVPMFVRLKKNKQKKKNKRCRPHPNSECVTREKNDESEQHYIESDDEENDMVVETMACNDGIIFDIFNVRN